jgi:hypothetical protein
MKKYLLGVCAIALAVGFSAFTGKGKKLAQGDVYVNSGLSTYTYIAIPEEDFNPFNCQDFSNNICAYKVTAAGATKVATTFDAATAEYYVNQGWIVELTTSKGLYVE